MRSGIRYSEIAAPAGGASRDVEREVDDELAFHVETRIEVLMSRGLTRRGSRSAGAHGVR